MKTHNPFFNQSVPMLPTEITIAILSRLPVQSLLRCKSVCKLWRSLISDPHFIKSHLSSSSTNNHYRHHRLICSIGPIIKTCHVHDLLCDNPINASELDYPFKQPNYYVSIIGSCNGLLCMSIGYDTLFIWNPSTKKSNNLPYPVPGRKPGYMLFGFGYDESTDDYKVVAIYCLSIDRSRYKTFVSLYSLKTGEWKKIDPFPNGVTPLNRSSQFSNGSLHWVAGKAFEAPYSSTIVSLDLVKETYGEVLQPAYDEGHKDLTLGALGEWLCVVRSYRLIRVDLWVMKVYGVQDSWTKLISIPYLTDSWRPQFLVPLCNVGDGKILLQFGYDLIVYDTKNSSFSEIQNFDRRLVAFTYVESLVSPETPNTSWR